MKNLKPNFFLVGASKSGTTSLYYYLKQHPDIFLSTPKEPRFFIFWEEKLIEYDFLPESQKIFNYKLQNSISNFLDYQNLFLNHKGKKIVGEASPIYLYHPHVAEKLGKYNPLSKILISLRNPFDACYSDYLHEKRQKHKIFDDLSFEEVLKSENVKNNNPWSNFNLIRSRFYDEQVERYLKNFPQNQVQVIIFNELENINLTIEKICTFLEVPHLKSLDTSLRFNTTLGNCQNSKASILTSSLEYLPLSIRNSLRYFIPSLLFEKYMEGRRTGFTNVKNDSQIQTTKCPLEAKAFLTPYFEPRIRRLEKILNRNLDYWLT